MESRGWAWETKVEAGTGLILNESSTCSGPGPALPRNRLNGCTGIDDNGKWDGWWLKWIMRWVCKWAREQPVKRCSKLIQRRRRWKGTECWSSNLLRGRSIGRRRRSPSNSRSSPGQLFKVTLNQLRIEGKNAEDLWPVMDNIGIRWF